MLENRIGLCGLSSEGGWNARSAQPLGKTRQIHNGNQLSLGSGAITSSSASGKHTAPPFLFFYRLFTLWSTFMWRKRHLLVFVTPLSSPSILSGRGWSLLFLFHAKDLESPLSMYDNLYLHGFEDSEAVSGWPTEQTKPLCCCCCPCVVTWWGLNLLGGVGGFREKDVHKSGCVCLCVCVCVWKSIIQTARCSS